MEEMDQGGDALQQMQEYVVVNLGEGQATRCTRPCIEIWD
jgi:hypothetical protein